MTLFFHGYTYTGFFKKSGNLTHRNVTHSPSGARTCMCTHTDAHTSVQTHTGPSVSASLLLCSPLLLSISFFPGAHSHTPGAWGLHFPSLSSLSENARIRFGKGSSFLCTVDSCYIPDKSWIKSEYKGSKQGFPLCLSLPIDELLNQAQMVCFYKHPHNIITALAKTSSQCVWFLFGPVKPCQSFHVTPDTEWTKWDDGFEYRGYNPSTLVS